MSRIRTNVLFERLVIIINSNPFVHLHIYTEYSLLDSTCRLEALFKKTKSLGMNALAITVKIQ